MTLRWAVRLALICGGTLLSSQIARADIIISARHEVPRLVLETGGPTGTVRALAFSADSLRFFSAGLDKTVQVWDVQPGRRGIVRTGGKAFNARSLRWEIARGLRGAIYALAASPTEPILAIAGYGAREPSGNVVLYDTAKADVERVLLSHQQTVVGLAYAPDGSKLASASVDGQLVVWTKPDWKPTVLRQPHFRKQFPGPQPIVFLTNRLLASATSDPADRATWKVAVFDVSRPDDPGKLLDQPHVGGNLEQNEAGLTALAKAPHSGRWASADRAGHVYLWDTPDANAPRLLRHGRVAASLAFGPDERLFVATLRDENRQSVVEMWDVNAAAMLDQVQSSVSENNFACAVSPDGARLVTCAGDGDGLYVFPLTDEEGARLAKPLSEGGVHELRGGGRRIWKVAFPLDGSYRIGIGITPKPAQRFNDYAEVEEEFDLSNPGAGRRGVLRRRWRAPSEGLGDWQVAADRNYYVLNLLHAGRVVATIRLDPDYQGAARSFCWLDDGAGRPYGIAVGTDRSYGAFVYRLDPAAGSCTLVRYFRDHNGMVTSLSVSQDGKYLCSGSVDQTIKVWSLAGIREADSAFAAAWGTGIEVRGGRATVVQPAPAGIAANRGLRNGDVVTLARCFYRGRIADLTSPQEIAAALAELPLWQTALLTVERRGRQLNRKILLVPAWEPLVTLYSDKAGEWALWTPQAYYDASVNGDTLFGWQMNRGLSVRPDFYRSDQFRDRLERPDVLRRLLSVGNLPEALRQAGAQAPDDLSTVLVQAIGKTPVVTIVSPRDGQELPDRDVSVVAQVEFPDDESATQATVQAFVNGVPGRPGTVAVAGRQRVYQWQVSPADLYNRVRVAVLGAAADQSLGSSNVYFRRPTRAQARELPRVHLLAIAAGAYKGKVLPALRFPVDDANSVIDVLRRNSKQLYQPGTVRKLLDQDVSRSQIDRTIAALTGELANARPDDVLVVFVAGHGFAFGKDYYFVPPSAKLAALQPEEITEADKLQAVLDEAAVSWTQLRRLAAIPCRKVFLLDTCFAGNVQLAEHAERNWKASIRPLVRDEVLVLSATDVNQEALEVEALGHGVFTKCLLDGLQGDADRSKDGEVELLELARYVEDAVPKITRQYQEQSPRVSPLDLFELIAVPLARYPQPGGG